MNRKLAGAIPQIKQAGFTLIELIVVIVILGILAATALPRFADLGNDARLASLAAARGSLEATSAMAHGRWLINPTAAISFESITLTMNATSGYPVANANLATAAGLRAADYLIVPVSHTPAGTDGPVTDADTIAIVPISLSGQTNAQNCFVSYTTPTTANAQPNISNLPLRTAC